MLLLFLHASFFNDLRLFSIHSSLDQFKPKAEAEARAEAEAEAQAKNKVKAEAEAEAYADGRKCRGSIGKDGKLQRIVEKD